MHHIFTDITDSDVCLRKYVRRLKEEGKRQREELKGGREDCRMRRCRKGGVWRWHRLKEEDVQTVWLSELPVVGFPLYRLAL